MMAKVESLAISMLSIGSICTATRSFISLFHDERVGYVARPLVGGDRDNVKAADAKRRLGIARHPDARRGGDAARLIRRHRLDREIGCPPHLHLDEGRHPAAPHDEIDLARARFEAARQEAPALEAQARQSQALGEAPATLIAPFCL